MVEILLGHGLGHILGTRLLPPFKAHDIGISYMIGRQDAHPTM